MSKKIKMIVEAILFIICLVFVFKGIDFVVGSYIVVIKYLPIVIIAHLIFFGLRILANKKWIGFIPSPLLFIGFFTFIGIIVYQYGLGSGYTILFSLVFGGIGISASLASLLLSILTEQFFMDTKEIEITKILKNNYEKLIILLGSVIWLFNYFDPTRRFNHIDAPWYAYIVVTLIICLISGVISITVYFIIKKKYQLLEVSLGLSLIFYIIHFLILYDYFRMMITMGVVLWLVVASLITMIYKNRNKNTEKIIEEGEFV